MEKNTKTEQYWNWMMSNCKMSLEEAFIVDNDGSFTKAYWKISKVWLDLLVKNKGDNNQKTNS